MIDADAALRMILEHLLPLDPVRVPLADACGCLLMDDVTSDMDMPPFNKSAMDGYAVRHRDLHELPVLLKLVDEVRAGQVPARPVGAGECARIMTGAPIPKGADAVVKREDTATADDGSVRVLVSPDRGGNICVQGEDVRKGDVIVRKGTWLRPQEIGLLASAGHTGVPVIPRPKAGIIATGDELVPPDRKPGPGQIRNSNSSQLYASVRAVGCPATDYGVARDLKDSLKRRLDAAVKECDMVILSAGVSVGEYDLVALVLQEAGVRILFHSVRIKPGKPTLFGIFKGKPVFGLPGNPAAVLVTFLLFVEPAIQKLSGQSDCAPRFCFAVAGGKMRNHGERREYHPVRLSSGREGMTATPVKSHGSADLAAACAANGFAVLMPGAELTRGEPLSVLLAE